MGHWVDLVGSIELGALKGNVDKHVPSSNDCPRGRSSVKVLVKEEVPKTRKSFRSACRYLNTSELDVNTVIVQVRGASLHDDLQLDPGQKRQCRRGHNLVHGHQAVPATSESKRGKQNSEAGASGFKSQTVFRNRFKSASEKPIAVLTKVNHHEMSTSGSN